MDRQKKIIKTSVFGILVNLVLVVFKATIGLIVNSIAITLDAVNNLTDAISSIVTIIGTKLANKAPDKDHPYGHGRIEYITAVIVATIVLIAGITAVKESVEKIINPGKTDYSIISMIIIAVAVFVKFFFGKYVKKVGRNVNSQSLVASGQDAFMDSILSFTTLIAAIINFVWHIGLEGYLGVIISIVIIKSAYEMLKETFNLMIGIRADKELTDKIKEKICEHEEVEGAYDLILHNYGPAKTIAAVHIQVADDMTAGEIHKLTRTIAHEIFDEFGFFITIGIYAANNKPELKEIKSDLDKIVEEYNEIKQVHGFYVDEENKRIFFDVIIDFECKSPSALKDEIVNRLSSKYSDYEFNVIIDADISE